MDGSIFERNLLVPQKCETCFEIQYLNVSGNFDTAFSIPSQYIRSNWPVDTIPFELNNCLAVEYPCQYLFLLFPVLRLFAVVEVEGAAWSLDLEKQVPLFCFLFEMDPMPMLEKQSLLLVLGAYFHTCG
jgi:hypothetical protein